jgi:hypothetical protein
MALTNTQDHYHTVLITAVKGSIVQAAGESLVIITMPEELRQVSEADSLAMSF